MEKCGQVSFTCSQEKGAIWSGEEEPKDSPFLPLSLLPLASLQLCNLQNQTLPYFIPQP